jgi:hypothetical protein
MDVKTHESANPPSFEIQLSMVTRKGKGKREKKKGNEGRYRRG